MPGTAEEGSRAIADKMLKTIRELKIPHENNNSGIATISIGITTGCLSHTQSWKDYIEKADEALYLSKNNGRDQSTYLALSEKQNEKTADSITQSP